jgi:hypothetical protein
MAELKQVTAGGLIKSSDWNKMVDEINGKVNRAGDIMTGALTVRDALNITAPDTSWNAIGIRRNRDAHHREGKVDQLRLSMGVNDETLPANQRHPLTYNFVIGHDRKSPILDINMQPIVVTSFEERFSINESESIFSGQLRVFGHLEVAGNLQVNGNWELGNRTGQVINAWNRQFGMGIQTNTLYFRSNTNFAWHKGGEHDNGEIIPGTGGALLMSLKPDGALTVNGPIHAGSSAIYFTKTDYNHTGVGNSEGHAAIENTSNHGALMILGRQVGPRRIVNLYDDANVPQGNLYVSGNTTIGGALKFGGRNGQLIDLSGIDPYGIGKQTDALYFRTADYFWWYQGGVHNDFSNTTSGGAKAVMFTDTQRNFYLTGGEAFKKGGGSWAIWSDKKLKKGIKAFEGALDKLSQLRGVNFEWKEPSIMGNQEGVQTGFIAQEVEKVFPEWIVLDRDGIKCIAVKGFEALVVESLKELKAEIEKIKTHLNI